VRRARRRDGGGFERGMTLLEVLIVLAVIALLMILATMAVRSVARNPLREDTLDIAATLRSAAELSAQSGIHHRVVFDLEKQTYQIEACPERIALHRDDEEKKVDAEVLESIPKPQPGTPSDVTSEITESEDPAQALAQSAALHGIQIGGARCSAPVGADGKPDARGGAHEVQSAKGVSIRRLDVAHLREGVSTGTASINFFPLGYAEKAVIELSNKNDEVFTIIVHGLTGQVEVRDSAIDPEEYMRRDAAGDEERER
jgi:prepilin-type N-terminal cleavage/methylation domain-containing protein